MVVKIMQVLFLLWMKIKEKLKEGRGQNTVEYLLMLTVIVGIVLVVAAVLKKWFPVWITQIQELLTGAAAGVAAPPE
jgi:hypothetical protein